MTERIHAAVALASVLLMGGYGSTATASADDAVIRGSLLIAGGGTLPPEIKERFVELASGAGSARILVLPMASGHPDTGPEQAEEFRSLGAEASSVSLTRTEAESASSGEVLEGVTGVWFTGGDQSRVTAAIGETPFLTALHELYRNGAVLGGSSAGAAVMSPLMITGDEHNPLKDRPDDDQTDAFLTIVRDNIVATRGLGFLPGTIVDQHFVRRKRHNRLLSLVLEHPDLVGVGIDESTAVEVGADGVWRVLGERVVVIYDARRAQGPKTGALEAAGVALHVLSAGSRYEPQTGTVRLSAGTD
jgi:cyanophycinase